MNNFTVGDNNTEQEKLVVEYCKSLEDTTSVFYKLNYKKGKASELLNIIHSGMFAFVFGNLQVISARVKDKKNKDEFLDESVSIFMQYIDNLRHDKCENPDCENHNHGT